MSPRLLSNSGIIYRRLLRYAQRYWKPFCFAIVGMLLVAGADASLAMLTKPLLDRGLVGHDVDFLKLVPVILLALFLARGVADFVSSYAMAWVGRRVIYDLRADMFNRMLLLPTTFYDENSSASLVSKLIYDIEQVAAASSTAIRILIQDSAKAIFLLGWLLFLNWRLTIVLLVLMPIIALLVRYASARFRVTSKLVQDSVGEIANVSKEALQANRIVKVFGGQLRERRNFERVNNHNRQMAMKKALVSASTVPAMLLVVGIGIAVVLWLAARQGTGEDGLSAGTFMSYLASLILMQRPIKNLARVNETIQTGVAAAGSVFAIVDEKAERDVGNLLLEDVRGDIVFEAVNFSYGEDERAAVLDNVSFRAASGQTIALVGPSGGGKTTLVSLLLRFYALSSGKILIDGIDIEDLELESLRNAIAVVSQDTMLFDDTIANNIAYGQRYGVVADTVDHDAMRAAAEAAHVIEFADQMPQGLDTQVGERGVLLSGGQRQRIAIARALYRNAPILVLDEATSALDNESEYLVQEASERLMMGRTTMVIAHRLSTIEHADLIVVLDNGQVVESGSHSQLIKQDGLYARLAKRRNQRAPTENIIDADSSSL